MKRLLLALLVCIGAGAQLEVAMALGLEADDPGVLDRADRLVVAAVLAAHPAEPFFAGETYRYDVRIEQVLGGEPGPRELEIAYGHYRPHLRGRQMVQPLHPNGSGSGSEASLAVGQRYLLLLHGAADAASAELVRAAATSEQQRLLAAWRKKLVFEGTVESLRALSAAEAATSPPLNWLVQTTVDRLLAGTFAGKHFQFRVHSPARSGLEVGRRVTVKAVLTDQGFHVDPDQWRP